MFCLIFLSGRCNSININNKKRKYEEAFLQEIPNNKNVISMLKTM